MPEPLIIHHPDSLLHDTGPFHPERAARIEATLSGLTHYEHKISRAATLEELTLVHPLSYIEQVKIDITSGSGLLSTGDVVLSLGTWTAALTSAGAALDAVDAVWQERRPFTVTRPPGHHAESEKGMGFCVFNNVALAARYARKKYGIKKILIADFDVHHGNGTEAIFYNDLDLFYFSTHQHPLYPGTGLKSTDHIVNFPIASGPQSRHEVLEAFNTLPLLMDRFKPELVIISAGFDAHKNDPLGGFTLEETDFGTLTEILVGIANRHSQGRILSCLEGGYDLTALRLSAKAHVAALA